MPKTLRWATILLVGTALVWITAGLMSVFGDPMEIEGVGPEQLADTPMPNIAAPLILGLVLIVLCVLARSGGHLARVFLTVASALVGLGGLISLVSGVIDYSGLSERVTQLGGHLAEVGVVVVLLVLFGVVAVTAVGGIVLLYLPSTNAYYREIRRLRRAARTAEE